MDFTIRLINCPYTSCRQSFRYTSDTRSAYCIPISQEEWKANMTTVYCIYWHPVLPNGMKDFTPRYVFTSVKIIRLLEQLVLTPFDTKEKEESGSNPPNTRRIACMRQMCNAKCKMDDAKSKTWGNGWGESRCCTITAGYPPRPTN